MAIREMALGEAASGSFLAGFVIILGSVSALAYRLYSNSIARFETRGMILSKERRVRLAFLSLFLGTVVIGAADFVFYNAYEFHVFTIAITRTHSTPHHSIQPLALSTGVIVTLAAVYSARLAYKMATHNKS
jgi:hypothetical protein